VDQKQQRRVSLLLIASFMLLSGLVALLAKPEPVRAFEDDLTAAQNRYPHIINTRIDDCTLCHTATSFAFNPYGLAYGANGENFAAIEPLDSDGDGFTNIAEINALTFPGDPADSPGVITETPTATATATATSTPTATPTGTTQPARRLYLPLIRNAFGG
jgi:hypothetical protein